MRHWLFKVSAAKPTISAIVKSNSAIYKGWQRGVGMVVSGVRRMNKVNPRRARLVPGWVTVFGWVYRLGM